MATNALNIGNNTADIDLFTYTDYYGFRFSPNFKLSERRGSAFAGQISSGGQTYEDASPFKRFVMDNFLGGFGQPLYNKVFGGVGLGGDDTKYLYGDCKTDRGGYLLPGMARNLIYNTTTAAPNTQMTPISSGADPVGGDESEVPRGVVPLAATTNSFTSGDGYNAFTSNAVATITNIRVLVQFLAPSSSGSTTISVSLRKTSDNSLKGVYSLAVNNNTIQNYTAWKWITLPLTSGAGSIIASDYFVTSSNGTNYWLGVCPQTDGSFSDRNYFYFQLMTSATPFKYFANPIQKVEHINSAGVYTNIALHSTGLFNLGATATGGTATTSPERLYTGGTYQGSLWFNSKLYVFTSTGVATYNYAQASTNGVATDALSGALIGRWPIEWGGRIYYITANGLGIGKWDGAFAPAGTQIVADDTIGTKGSVINKLFVFQGNLWVIKAEGVFQLYADPTTISTAAGNLPRINPMGDPFPSIHPDTGKWYVQHMGSFYLNYRDRIYQYTPSTTGPIQVTVIPLPIPWYRLSYYHYCNGLASDGVSLYASFNNLGTYQYLNQTWHPVCEFYEQVATEGQASGLRWTPNPTSAPDNIFVGDGRTIVQLPIPSASLPYTQQIYQNHQNKCGYFVSSGWDGEQADISKFVQSIVLRAVPSNFSYKIVAVAYQAGQSPSFSSLIQRGFLDGLGRDNWMAPTSHAPNQFTVTTQVTAGGAVVAGTAAPTCWVASDFNNSLYASEKLSATTLNSSVDPTDVTLNIPKFTRTAFIVYFWNPTPGQHASTNVGADLMAIDSIAVKYQAVLDYIAIYKVSLSCKALTEGVGVSNLTTAQAEDSWDWLRSQFGRHSPLKVRIRTRTTNDASGKNYRQFFALLQNPTDEYGTPLVNLDSNSPLPERVDFELVGTAGEYGSV